MHRFILQINPVAGLSSEDEPTLLHPESVEPIRVLHWKWRVYGKRIKREVCRAYGVEEKDLLTAQRGRSNEPWNVAIYLGRVLRNDTLMELGQAFGMTGYSPAGSAVDRVKKKLFRDSNLQKKIKKIEQSLLA